MKRRTQNSIAAALTLGTALGLFGCGEAKQVSVEAKPSTAGTASVVRVENTVTRADMDSIQAIIGRASTLGMMPSNVNFLNGGETFDCEDKPRFTATSSDLLPRYCTTNRTGIVTAAQVNEAIHNFGTTDADREAARNYVVATGFATKMRADAGANLGKTDRQNRVMYACFAGVAMRHLNPTEGQIIVNDLVKVPDYGYDAAKAFLQGANMGGCEMYGLQEYGDANNIPPASPLPTASPTS